MTETTELLGSAIYEIKEVWKGPDELWQANCTEDLAEGPEIP